MKIIKALYPPIKWKFWVILILSILFGIIIFIIYVSKAFSYLSDSPETCMNCHIMAPQYSTWFHSSHREFTNCNECHVPQDNILRGYMFKAKDGLRHATIFTLRKEPQVIRIKEEGKKVVHENCLRCHSDLFDEKYLSNYSNTIIAEHLNRDCMFCHRETPHSTITSLSSAPNARVPLPESAVPLWLKKIMNK